MKTEYANDTFNINELGRAYQKENRLFNIMFVLLSQCNQQCIHCYIPDHSQKGLSTEKIKSLILEARELGALNVTFTGGEILLRRDLLELIAYARSLYMRVFLMSNGYALDESLVTQLAHLHIAGFSTTIFSMSENLHDMITQVPGSLSHVLKNIELLVSEGIDVTIKTPLMECNKYAYFKVEEYAQKHGCVFMATPTIFSKTNGDSSPHQLAIQTDLPSIVCDTDRIMEKLKGKIECVMDGEIPCSAGFSNICVNYDGMVWPCNTLTMPVGNVQCNSLTNIWKSSEELVNWRINSRSLPVPCSSCELHSKCTRCPGLAYLEDRDAYGCSTSSKLIARSRKSVEMSIRKEVLL